MGVVLLKGRGEGTGKEELEGGAISWTSRKEMADAL